MATDVTVVQRCRASETAVRRSIDLSDGIYFEETPTQRTRQSLKRLRNRRQRQRFSANLPSIFPS